MEALLVSAACVFSTALEDSLSRWLMGLLEGGLGMERGLAQMQRCLVCSFGSWLGFLPQGGLWGLA